MPGRQLALNGATLPVWGLFLLKGADLAYDHSGRAAASQSAGFCGRAPENCEDRLTRVGEVNVFGEASDAICEKSAGPTAAGDEYEHFSAELPGLLASVCGLLWTKLGQLTLCAYRWICPRRTGAIATAPRLNVAMGRRRLVCQAAAVCDCWARTAKNREFGHGCLNWQPATVWAFSMRATTSGTSDTCCTRWNPPVDGISARRMAMSILKICLADLPMELTEPFAAHLLAARPGWRGGNSKFLPLRRLPRQWAP